MPPCQVKNWDRNKVPRPCAVSKAWQVHIFSTRASTQEVDLRLGLPSDALPMEQRIGLAKNLVRFCARCARASDVKSGFALLGFLPMLSSCKERIVLAKNRVHFFARCVMGCDRAAPVLGTSGALQG